MYKLFFKIILLHTVVFSHQFFLTTTEVRLSDNQKNLEVTIQTFSHDVEALLKAADFNLANLGSDREDNAIDIAKKYNASAVVLKGHNTLVYIKSEDKTFICENGGPELATGGTGDILAGIIRALLAQNLPLKESCLLAVASHAKAGENFVEDVGEIGLNASTLIPIVRKILNK